jgi:phosphotransferase system  glucose/maltose/N-acetylglucosamine-specific IIC component
MLAKYKVNIVLGLISLLFTYLFSFVNNTWQTSLIWAVGGFILFFLLGFAFHFMIKQMADKTYKALKEKSIDTAVNQETEMKNTKVEELADEASFQSVPLHSLHNLGEGNKTV